MGGNIEVCISICDGKVIIVVKDNGEGILVDKLKLVFDMFI